MAFRVYGFECSDFGWVWGLGIGVHCQNVVRPQIPRAALRVHGLVLRLGFRYWCALLEWGTPSNPSRCVEGTWFSFACGV